MGARVTVAVTGRNVGFALATVAMLGGASDPAPDLDAAIRATHAQDVRLATVGYRLARGCAGLGAATGGHVTTAGMLVQDIAQYGPTDRAAAQRVLRLGDGPTIAAIVPGSAADRARLSQGDVVVSVNGAPLDADIRRSPYARMTQFDRMVAQAPGDLRLDIRRADGTERVVTVGAEPGCASIFQLVGGGLRRTSADGTYVQISQAMFDLADGDDALAAVAAHELAHNILRHAALKTPSKRAETEADRLSVWLVARAGYDLDRVVPFWQQVRKRSDYGIFADGSHPAWKGRIAAIAAAVTIAKAQRAAGQPLVPPAQEGASQPPKPR